ANVASWLCDQGLRVVMIDWDLEAPGLESYFFAPDQIAAVSSSIGLIDLLWSYRRTFPKIQWPKTEEGADTTARQAQLKPLLEWLPPLAHTLVSIRDGLSLLSAGWRGEDRFTRYAEAVQRFDWTELYSQFRGEAYFEWMRRELTRAADVVLIDSRTGVTEM